VFACDFMPTDSRLSPRWNLTLANFEDYEGYVVGEGAVTSTSSRRSGLPALTPLNWSLCRFEDQRFKAFDAEHVVKAVEDLDQSVGVENQTVSLG
jgi:hypothetical protein